MPALIAKSGGPWVTRFREFMASSMRNPNTRSAYLRAIDRFLAWCAECGLSGLQQVEPGRVDAYFREHPGSRATVRQHLAALRGLFDAFLDADLIAVNPVSRIRAPDGRPVVRHTPILTPQQTRSFLESIECHSIVGLRDRAIIAVMVYAFARVGALVTMLREDYFESGGRYWLRLHERGGRPHAVPAHRTAASFVQAYLNAAQIDEPGGVLFRSVNRRRELTAFPLTRTDVLRMVKRRARASRLPPGTSCRSFRATGLSAYLENGGSLERAQAIAAHKSPRSTRRYAPPQISIPPDDLDRIRI